ncbi:MAG: ATP-binding protein [Clostridiales bacterium]|nr:ATP-binding protein [Clostridiales bacterium]
MFSKTKKALLKCFELTEYKFSHKLHFKDFYDYFFDWKKLIDYSDEKNDLLDLISLRNYYAHGSTANEEKSKKEIIRYLPMVKSLLEKSWLKEVSVIVFREKREEYIYVNQSAKINGFYNSSLNDSSFINKKIKFNTPYFLNSNGQLLECFPIITYNKRIENNNDLLFFLNDCKKLKQDKISLLNYPNSIHYVDNKNTRDFLARMDLLNWSKLKVDRFQERINGLTENFYGRTEELTLLWDFVQVNKKGFFILSAKQGMGKSALIAKFIQELRTASSMLKPYFIEYFVRANTLFSSPSFFLDYLCEKLKEILKITDFIQTDTLEEKQALLEDLLNIAAETLSDKKLVIIIDGLDEGVESGLINCLINNVYNNILVIYSSRLDDQPEIKSFYYRIDKTVKYEHKLGPLSKNDIKAVLFNSLDKYYLIQNEELVNLIQEKSKGEPLYLKLLIMAIEDNQISLYSIDKIPDSINKWFEDNISRLLSKELGNEVFQTLIIFAVAKDNITKKQLEIYLNNCNLNINSATVEKIINILSDWLQESDDNIASYQLFHHELRQYLLKNYYEACKFAEKSIIDVCSKWDKYLYIGEGVYKYSLIYYIDHLISLDLFDDIASLIQNEAYIDEQIKVCKGYYASFRMLEKAREYFNKSPEMIIKVMLTTIKLYKKMDSDKYKLIEKIETYNLDEIYAIIDQIKSFDKDKELIYTIILDKIVKSENDETELFNIIAEDIKGSDNIWLDNIIADELLVYLYLKLSNHKYSYMSDEFVNVEELIGSSFFNITKELIDLGIDKLFIRYINKNKDRMLQTVILNFCESCIKLGCIEEFSKFMDFIENKAIGKTFEDKEGLNTGKKFINNIYFNAFSILMKDNDITNAEIFLNKISNFTYYDLTDIILLYNSKGLNEQAISYLNLFKKEIMISYNEDLYISAKKVFSIIDFCEKVDLKEEAEFYFSFIIEYLNKNKDDDIIYALLIDYINNKNDDNYFKYLPSMHTIINLDSLDFNYYRVNANNGKSLFDILAHTNLIKFYLTRKKYNEVLRFLDLFSKKNREMEGICLLYSYYFSSDLDKKFIKELLLKINKWTRSENPSKYGELFHWAVKEVLLSRPELHKEILNNFKISDYKLKKYIISGFIRKNNINNALELFKLNENIKDNDNSDGEKISYLNLTNYYKSNSSKLNSSAYKVLLRNMLEYYEFVTNKNKSSRKFWDDYTDNLILSLILKYLKYIALEEAKLLCSKMEKLQFSNNDGENFELKANFETELKDAMILDLDYVDINTLDIYSLDGYNAIELIKKNKLLNNNIRNYYGNVFMTLNIIDFKLDIGEYRDAIKLINSFSELEYRLTAGFKLLLHQLKNKEVLYLKELLIIFDLAEDVDGYYKVYLEFLLNEAEKYVTEKSLKDFAAILKEHNLIEVILAVIIRVARNTEKFVEYLNNIPLKRTILEHAMVSFGYYLYEFDKDNKLLYEIDKLFLLEDIKLKKEENYLDLMDMVKKLMNKEISLDGFKDYVYKL